MSRNPEKISGGIPASRQSMAVLMEGVRSEFQVVAESQTALNGKVDALAHDVATLTGIMQLKIKTAVNAKYAKVSQRSPRRNAYGRSFDYMPISSVFWIGKMFELHNSGLKDDVREIKTSQDIMRGDIGSLRKDVTVIKDRQSRMEADINEIKLELKSIRKELTELRAQISQKAEVERINNLEERVARIEQALQSRQ